MGGKLYGYWYAFGDADGSLVEAPDDITAATLLVKVASAGEFRHVSTTKLPTVDEALEVMRRAAVGPSTGPRARLATDRQSGVHGPASGNDYPAGVTLRDHATGLTVS